MVALALIHVDLKSLFAQHEGGGLAIGLFVLDDEYAGHDSS